MAATQPAAPVKEAKEPKITGVTVNKAFAAYTKDKEHQYFTRADEPTLLKVLPAETLLLHEKHGDLTLTRE